MRVTETIRKIDRIDQLIRLKATGTPKELCKRLEISKSTWHEFKKMMIEEFNFPIAYNRLEQTYYYTEQGQYIPPTFRSLKQNEMKNLVGKGYRCSLSTKFHFSKNLLSIFLR